MANKAIDHQIRYFLGIADAGSLSAAADALEITQSALSKQLGLLEERVGQPLFFRTGRGVHPTDAGLRLLNAVRPAYSAIDAAVEALRRDTGITEGVLRIATVHTVSYYFIADLLSRFLAELPKVNVSVLGRSSPGVVELVETNRADIGFVYDTAVTSAGVTRAALFDEQMCLVTRCGNDLPVLGVDLANDVLPLVVFPPHYALGRMLCQPGFRHRVAAEVENVDVMLTLVGKGLGHCVLPTLMPERMLSDRGLTKIPLTGTALSRKVVAVTRRQERQTHIVDRMLEIARATAMAAGSERAAAAMTPAHSGYEPRQWEGG